MKIHELVTETGNCQIFFDRPFHYFRKFCHDRQMIVITDDNVKLHYEKELSDVKLVSIPAGEKHKSLETVKQIVDLMLDLGVNKSWTIVGMGGGVVCDITGFVASVYKRGLSVGFVPTTLLAQTDAAIGGKNAVNYGKMKNLLGTIRQPEWIVCDPKVLETLPFREWKNGMAEVIKHAVIGDIDLFEMLEGKNIRSIVKSQPFLEQVLRRSIQVKIKYVEEDVMDRGTRNTLNFGHTIGHAIELIEGINHGEAISMGMMAELKQSLEEGLISNKTYNRIKLLLEKYRLPTELNTSPEMILGYIGHDKKINENNWINQVLISEIGCSQLVHSNLTKIEKLLK